MASLVAISALLMLAGAGAQGGVLIDPTTGNGSFEDSTVSISPWSAVSYGTTTLTPTVGTNPADATHGSNHLNYAITTGGGFNQADLNRYFLFGLPYSSTTHVFALSFDIRGTAAPFVQFSTYQSDNSTPTPTQPTLQSNSAPAISSSTYTNWYYEWRADPSWNGTRTELRLIFGGFVPNSSYSVDMDNFLMLQVPEPSVLLLSGVGGLLLWWRRR
jgi:hypothetical protein